MPRTQRSTHAHTWSQCDGTQWLALCDHNNTTYQETTELFFFLMYDCSVPRSSQTVKLSRIKCSKEGRQIFNTFLCHAAMQHEHALLRKSESLGFVVGKMLLWTFYSP